MSIRLVTFIFAFLVLGGTAHADGLLCAGVFGESNQPTSGSNLGPIELVRNLKQKFFPSRLVKNFDQKIYREAVEAIKTHDLRVEDGFRPENLEQAIAYLDVQLDSLSISIQSMPPVIRHKIYKTVTGVLQSQGRSSYSVTEGLSDLIFRGSYTKPTSFYNILTHLPQSSGREMFIQHLHTLEVTSIVTAAYDYSPGPRKPGIIARNMPRFAKDHNEILTSAFWGGISAYGAVSAHSIDAIFLPSFNVFKTKKYKAEIEQVYLEKSLEAAIEKMEVRFKNASTANYTYAVLEKAINWYFVGSLLMIFVEP